MPESGSCVQVKVSWYRFSFHLINSIFKAVLFTSPLKEVWIMKCKCIITYSDKQERKSKCKKMGWEEPALEEQQALQPRVGARIPLPHWKESFWGLLSTGASWCISKSKGWWKKVQMEHMKKTYFPIDFGGISHSIGCFVSLVWINNMQTPCIPYTAKIPFFNQS